jgi:hypothetical protein
MTKPNSQIRARAKVNKQLEILKRQKMSYNELLFFAASTAVTCDHLEKANQDLVRMCNEYEGAVKTFSDHITFRGVCFHGFNDLVLTLMAKGGNTAAKRLLRGVELSKKYDAQMRALKKIEIDRDGKQAAKKFAKECWIEWQSHPDRYGKQSQFAIDVLEKIETNAKGEPIVSLDTILKKWIPEWNKEIKEEKK